LSSKSCITTKFSRVSQVFLHPVPWKVDGLTLVLRISNFELKSAAFPVISSQAISRDPRSGQPRSTCSCVGERHTPLPLEAPPETLSRSGAIGLTKRAMLIFGLDQSKQLFVQQRHRTRQQSYRRSMTFQAMCQYLVLYFVAPLFIPAMTLFNVVIYATNQKLRNEIKDGTSAFCGNGMTVIEGYLALYVLMCVFWIAYAVFRSPLCANQIKYATWSRFLFRFNLVVGLLVLLATVAFNLAASYWATEANFRSECWNRSPELFNSVIANVVLGHIVFDLICFALFPLLFEMYQWL